jgi:hypothetical protein
MFLDGLLLSKPKPRMGRKLKLLQLTGEVGCSEYVRLNLHFQSQLGLVCLRCVEAYAIKGMKANMIIGEDAQRAWQLHTIDPEGKHYWKVGDTLHQIPALPGSTPEKSFSATRTLKTLPEWKPLPPHKAHNSRPRKTWNTISKYDHTILPESIATVMAISRGAPNKESLYLEGIPLKRGSDSFISAPHGIMDLDSQDCFQIKLANTTKCRICLHAGELLGHLS